MKGLLFYDERLNRSESLFSPFSDQRFAIFSNFCEQRLHVTNSELANVLQRVRRGDLFLLSRGVNKGEGGNTPSPPPTRIWGADSP